MKNKKLSAKSRKTLAKKIKMLARKAPLDALALAHYGHDGERVSKILSGTQQQGALFDLIQNWLFLKAQRTEPSLIKLSTPEEIEANQKDLEAETVQLFVEHIFAQDSEFFRRFADLLDEGIKFRDAATFKLRDQVRADLLANKFAGKIVNLSSIAKRYEISVRTVWEVNREIGAKTPPRGRPAK